MTELIKTREAHSISILARFRLCALCVFSPGRFVNAEKRIRESLATQASSPTLPNAKKIQRAFFTSFAMVLASIGAGVLFSLIVLQFVPHFSAAFIQVLQLIGGGVLLWGTLYDRGWDIQTIAGSSLSERVNQWIYRGLYCFGTAMLSAATSLSIFS